MSHVVEWVATQPFCLSCSSVSVGTNGESWDYCPKTGKALAETHPKQSLISLAAEESKGRNGPKN